MNMRATTLGPGPILDELVGYADEFGSQQGWKAVRVIGGVRYNREGFVRLIVAWLGGERWLLSWEYGSGTGALVTDWRAEIYGTDEIGLHTHMVMTAMWR